MQIIRYLFALLLLLLTIPTNAQEQNAICPSQCHPTKVRKTTNGARIFYLVIVHNRESMDDAVHLLRAIRDPRNIIAIHVDAKANHLLQDSSLLLIQEIKQCPCGSPIIIDSVHNVQWSQWSMNLPTFWGLEVAVRDFPRQWDVFINLAGNTLPVYTPDTIASLLQELPYNFVTSSSCETGLIPTSVYRFPKFWHKRRHYTRDETEPDPTFTFTEKEQGELHNKTLQIFFGSQWVILQVEFCEWFVAEMQRSDSLAMRLAEYLRQSGRKMTDETFLPTLLMHTEIFSATLPKTIDNYILLWRNGTASGITDVRYERMDEHVPTAFGHLWEQQRYDVPDDFADKPRPWGPYFLGVYDLANIRASGALFVRKISSVIDPNMIRLLPVERAQDIPMIQWPVDLKVTDKPNWKALIREALEKSDQQEEKDDISGTNNMDDEEL